MADHIDVTNSVHQALKTDDFDKVYQYCKDNSVLFMDKQFPNTAASLYQVPAHPEYRGQWKSFGWSRASAILGQGKYNIFANQIDPSDIRQGQLGDCYFLCALASMAEQPSLIRRLFYLKETNTHGVLGIWLHINGAWKLFILDEYFPSTTASGKPDFVFSKSVGNDLWVCALEKAYAKAYGSFFDITGGDPVHALRDLSGAPYDRIEDYSDLAKAWAKLKESNAQNFILTCFTKSTQITEEKSESGLVSGHAYSIMDVREVIDSRGKVRMILEIRNPWGKFEWKGEFSDKSPLWTAEAKRSLKVEDHDDGVFWMPFERFVEAFEGIGILKALPGYVNNSVLVKRSKPIDRCILRLGISDPKVNLTVSVDQIDSKTIDERDYQLSYFRVTIGRIVGKDTIEFVNSVLSPERNIFLEDTYTKGDYVILVEAYWSNRHPTSFVVGTYSDFIIDLDLLSSDVSLYGAAERLIWVSFASKHKDRLKPLRSRTITQGKEKAAVDLFNFQDQNYGLNLYATFNNSGSSAVHQTYKVLTNSGYDVIASSSAGDKFEIIANPKDHDIILFKMNPLIEVFKLSHQVSSEELISKGFQKDIKTVEMLSQLGAQHPTAKNDEPQVVARDQAKAAKEADAKKNSGTEANRKKAIEEQKVVVQDKIKNMQLFWKNQKDLLEEFARANNPIAQKYLDMNNKNVDPFYVLTESFKEVGKQINGDAQYRYYGGGQTNGGSLGQGGLNPTNWFNSYSNGGSNLNQGGATQQGQAGFGNYRYEYKQTEPTEQQYGYNLYGTSQVKDNKGGCHIF
jgi:hypothetical protein